MSHLYQPLRGPALAGLLLSLGLLAGCESDSGSSASDGQAVANVGGAGTTETGQVDPGQMDPIQAASAELVRVGDRVFFATDRYDIAAESEAVLQRQAALLQTYPAVTVTIEGHADERGTREYNLALAERRAAAVRNYLIALGSAGERLETVSFGKERPDCAEAAESCWSRNRRGVTAINP